MDWFLGGIVILLTLVAPWFFGCTEPWSVAFMNWGSFLAGTIALLIFFLGFARRTPLPASERLFSRSFLACNLTLLLFCVVAFFNARATFSNETLEFSYRTGVIPWLPTTYDRDRTLQFLVNSLGLFVFFWTLRFWLGQSNERSRNSSGPGAPWNKRLRLFLWLFTVNGFLVALQGLLQRLSNSSYLLWFRRSYWDTPDACFGPFCYRGNAADYLNLVWPITFGFWYVLARRRDQRGFGIGDGPEMLLLPMFLVTAAATFATLSRGGAVVAAVMLVLLVALLLTTRTSRSIKISLASAVIAVVVVAVLLSGESLAERFHAAFSDNLSGRTEIYDNVRPMIADFPVFGAGPGAFPSIYQLYRENADQRWAAFLHDDWLETRVTFGRVGMTLVLIQLALLILWTYSARKRWISPVLGLCFLLAIAGCLAHAKRDFPFQTYGIFFTFVVVCAFLTSAVARVQDDSFSAELHSDPNAVEHDP